MKRATATLILKQGRDKPVHNHHPWVFSGAIERVKGQPAPGDLVTIANHKGEPLATAYFNAKSQIQARILSWNPDEPIDADFWRGRLRKAIEGRAMMGLIRNYELEIRSEEEATAYRLVNAEADGLPGLIVDRYNDFLVIQCQTLGINRCREMLTELLAETLSPAGILERSDVDTRGKEGLPPVIATRYGEAPPPELIIRENGFSFLVDVHHGHKTGFYLDQRDNRAAIGPGEGSLARLLDGRDVLNVFAYTGAFGIYAAAAGARQITHVDSSVPALETAERNAQLNGLERPDDEYIAGDAFEVLRYFRQEGRQFDAIILDPPKFAHSQGQIDRAARGYKDLNWLALRLLRPDGVLATFSCSGLVSADLFQKIVFGAAVDAGRDVQIVRHLGQATDHPILLSFPESAYLKGLLCRAL
jgi:23S rRNA (cytosine1962-C5)-methyltransferase